MGDARTPDLGALATLSEEELAATLALPRATLEALEKTIVDDPRATLEPAPVISADSSGGRALDGLDALGDERAQGILASLSMGRTLGEGGMGIVRLAEQRSLGRSVAVKTLRADDADRATKLRLLREAWVTGALEHPNIVPVYDLGLDERGKPVIVLKHIEGASWESVLEDPAALPGASAVGQDPLERNLRILVQICQAASLAHSRGVLHRDIKPENVMLGRFGEVYLVDWGIAVSLFEDPTGRLPRARESHGICGTPCYLAPEMLGIGVPLSERTDVYLLGATLHHVLTGAPPHTGATLREIMSSALLSRFSYPPEVPAELARIAQRAMSRAPEDRHASANELREDLERYLQDRGAHALFAAANARLTELDAALSEPEPDRERVYRLFSECRFGLRQAYAASPRCGEAKEALERAARRMIAFELEHGTADAAEGHLAELDPAPADLKERVEAAARAQRARADELERIATANDPSLGRRTRVFAASLMGVLWTVLPLVMKQAHAQLRPLGYTGLAAQDVLMSAIALAVGFWGRESLTKTLVNRRMMALVTITFAAHFVVSALCASMGIPLEVSLILRFALWFTVSAAAAATIDVRLFPVPLTFAAAGLVAAKRPEWLYELSALANFSMLVTFIVAWAKLDLDKPRVLGGPGVERAPSPKRKT